MRILLAEDERELSDALVMILKHNNYSVDAVYNGQDALDYIMADDYLSKPFAAKELLARLRAVTRRKTATATTVLKMGNMELDCASFELRSEKESLHLPNKEFQMMEMMMANPGQLISTERFLEKVWGYDTETDTRTVWVYISYLRKKLQELGADIKIKAARGLGYSLVVSE